VKHWAVHHLNRLQGHLGLDLLGNSRVGKRAEKGFLDSKDRRCLVKHLD
jgi:hypothetical protein